MDAVMHCLPHAAAALWSSFEQTHVCGHCQCYVEPRPLGGAFYGMCGLRDVMVVTDRHVLKSEIVNASNM